MNPVYQRLLEIATDQGKAPPVPGTYFQELLSLSSGRISQISDPLSVAKVGTKGLANLAALGYNPKWVNEGSPNKKWLAPPFSALSQSQSQSAQSVPLLISLSDHPDLLSVPRVKFKLSAGVSGFAVDPENGNGKPIFFRKDWFEENNYRPGNLFAVRVSGCSMEPSLWDGDLVVINTDDTEARDGEVFAINYEGEMVIKRLRRDAGDWWASSDNADQRRFAPKRCTEDVVLIGRVIYKQSERI